MEKVKLDVARGKTRDEREMTGINGTYADTRNSIGLKTSRNRNKSEDEEES